MELHKLAPHATMSTYVYKVIDGIDISLDVYLPDVTKFGLVAKEANDILRNIQGLPVDKGADTSLPIVLYWHGGGMSSGNKDINDWFPKFHLKDSLNAGFCFISADYTLLSPHTGHDVILDVQDCITFIATKLNQELAKLPNSQLVNPNRMAVSGSSGGGYPAYLSGLYGSPKPKALGCIYAMGGNLLSDYYLHPKTKPFFPNVDVMLPDEIHSPIFLSPSTTPRIISTGLIYPDEPRVNFCVWLLQTGLAISALLGLPANYSKSLALIPELERKLYLSEKDKKLFPELNIDSNFPPTVFLHARGDTAVLIEESRNMLRLMKAEGVEGELLECEGQHCFDLLEHEEGSLEKQNLDKFMEFLIKHV